MPFEPPHAALIVLWCLWAAQAAWSCINVRKHLARGDRLLRRKNRMDAFEPFAAIIVPVRGAGEHFADHVRALAGQKYPAYRLIFVVESEQDPAYGALQELRGPVAREMSVVVAGHPDRGGQKVHNQLRGLRELRDTDEVVVFADADAVPHDRWLSLLVHPLHRDWAGATTGYRWLVPVAGDLPSSFASVINASIATLLGPPRRNHAWGGSMAMTRQMVNECRLAEHWEGALSDDYQLTRAVSRCGRKIVFVPRCLVVSPVRHTWASLVEFGRRQYIITRVHSPLLWLAALLITGLYTAGWVSAIVAAVIQTRGWAWGFVAWLAVVLFDLQRAALRRRTVRDLLGKDVVRELRPVWRLERWATPLWMGLHLLIILSAAVGRRITWAGTTYHLRSRQDVRIVRRAGL